VSRYEKGKTNLDFTDARDSEWQWHQLGHVKVCTSLQTDNHASTPPLCVYTGRMLFLPPYQQRQSTEGSGSEGTLQQVAREDLQTGSRIPHRCRTLTDKVENNGQKIDSGHIRACPSMTARSNASRGASGSRLIVLELTRPNGIVDGSAVSQRQLTVVTSRQTDHHTLRSMSVAIRRIDAMNAFCSVV